MNDSFAFHVCHTVGDLRGPQFQSLLGDGVLVFPEIVEHGAEKKQFDDHHHVIVFRVDNAVQGADAMMIQRGHVFRFSQEVLFDRRRVVFENLDCHGCATRIRRIGQIEAFVDFAELAFA